MKPTRFLSAADLKLLACLLMLIDHVGMLFFPQIILLRLIGRLAFPIFAFQIAEGYRHTKSFPRYTLRLLFFALLSEVPFDLAVSGQWFSVSHQNVLFTLLLGLLGCHLLDQLTILQKSAHAAAAFVLCLCGIGILILAGDGLNTDYGIVGVLTVMLFYTAGKSVCPLMIQGLGMLLLHGVALPSAAVSFFGVTISAQSFALLSLPMIAAYNGTKGPQNRIIQYGCYLFYPFHLLILSLIA